MSNALPVFVLATAVAAFGADVQDHGSEIARKRCGTCHNGQSQTAGIDITQLVEAQPWVRHRDEWGRISAAVEEGRMPPDGTASLAAEERGALLEAIRQAVDEFDYSSVKNAGHEPTRRLSHTEYDNTIRDLLGVDLRPSERFTPEMTGETGFDNSANTLFLQPALMERYIAAAERISEELGSGGEASRTLEKLVGGAVTDASARDFLPGFLLGAFRRPPHEDERARAHALYDEARADGLPAEAALRQVVAATLISPHFLLRTETAPAEGAEPVSDWEIASRLSYFLWATMPDAELFRLAEAGELGETEVLAAQVERMLADERAETLGTVFAAQWLGFGHVGSRIRLGPIDFPWCTDSLMDAMRAESSMFFMSLVRENRPVAALVDADYTFANEELADTLYGWDGIEGAEMRRVSLDDPRRGGVLGQGAILAVTSNYNKTSPVKRGHWILETLLGTPPPPPPPNAGVFDDEVGAQRELTFRQKLAQHSKNESCRACHAKIDPLGFPLENFDYFGRWRETYTLRIRTKKADDANIDPDSNFRKVEQVIDVSGVLPEGAEFEGPAGLKHALIEHRHDDLVRQTVTKTLAYSLGRQLEWYDEPTVRQIIGHLEKSNYGFRTLVHEVVRSYPFRYKQQLEED